MKAGKLNALIDTWDSQLLTAAAVLMGDVDTDDETEAREWAVSQAIKLRLELTTQYVAKFGDIE